MLSNRQLSGCAGMERSSVIKMIASVSLLCFLGITFFTLGYLGPLSSEIDVLILRFVQLFGSGFVGFSYGIALITSVVPAVLIMLVVLLPLIHLREYRIVVEVLSAVGISALTGALLKLIFAVQRPIPTYFVETGYSYPSLHAVISWSFATSVLLWLSDHHKDHLISPFVRSVIRFVVVIGAILISLSRVSLGVHRGTDIIAGAFLGIGVSCLVYYLFSKQKN